MSRPITIFSGKRRQTGQNGQTPDDLGDQTETDKITGFTEGKGILPELLDADSFIVGRFFIVKPDDLPAAAPLDDVVKTAESTAADKKDV